MPSRWASMRPPRSCATPRDHGVEVRPVCINASRWDCTLEPTDREDRFAVRLGLRMVHGLANAHAAAIVAARADRPFASVDDLWRRAGVPAAALVQIAEADAFRPALKLARREALWAIKALRDEPLPLFAAASARESTTVPEVDEPACRAAADDRRRRGGRGLWPCRPDAARASGQLSCATICARQRIVTCAEAMQARDGRWLETAGLVLVRQKPGSAKGVMFITLEDETGIANLVVWPQLFEKHRRVVLSRQHDGRPRPHPARRRGRPSGRAPAHRSVGGACQRRRAGRRLPAAARPRRPGPPRWRARSARAAAQGAGAPATSPFPNTQSDSRELIPDRKQCRSVPQVPRFPLSYVTLGQAVRASERR